MLTLRKQNVWISLAQAKAEVLEAHARSGAALCGNGEGSYVDDARRKQKVQTDDAQEGQP